MTVLAHSLPCTPAPLGLDSLLSEMAKTTRDDPAAVVLSVGGLVGQEVNLDEFLHQLVDRIAKTMQADRGTLYLLDFSRGEIFSRAAHLPELKDLKVAVERKDAAGNVTTELVAPARAPTVHDLMTHRAGFTYFFFPKNALRDRYRELGIDRVDTLTADEMLQKLGTLPLAFQPGTQFEYSIATDLLGHIIERVTRKPLDVALDELVLGPLQMRDTSFLVKGPALARFARPLSTDPDPWVFEWLDLTRQPKRFAGGAGMASTVSDYLRPLQMLMNGGELDGVRLLSPATVRWAMADQVAGMRGPGHPGDGYSWNLFNPVRVSDVGTVFPGDVGDIFWGGITGPRYFMDPKERLIGIVFIQAPSQRAAYHAELRAMVYGALTGKGGR